MQQLTPVPPSITIRNTKNAELYYYFLLRSGKFYFSNSKSRAVASGNFVALRLSPSRPSWKRNDVQITLFFVRNNLITPSKGLRIFAN